MTSSPAASVSPRRLRLATAWLAGCSGCHMSFLDLDLDLLELAAHADLVASPVLSDIKSYPDGVDLCLVEGAVATEEHRAQALWIRSRTTLVVALGDCAIHTNITGLRHRCRHWSDHGSVCSRVIAAPKREERLDPPLPTPLAVVLPLDAVIAVDASLPGCPPEASAIASLLRRWWQGRPLTAPGSRPQRFG
ncbi:MAG: oxidoreductase [Cyanobacteriota bacterium]